MDTFGTIIKSNITRVSKEVKKLDVESIARHTGILRRKERKLSASNLLLALLALSAGIAPTMERVASAIRLILGKSYSKQAVCKRLGLGIDQFLGQATAHVFARVHSKAVKGGIFASFRRVLLQDSTTLRLPERFHTSFKGSANQNRNCKQSIMRIQLVSDMLCGKIYHLSLSSFTRNDLTASEDILSIARSGDLVLRDLGYFVIENFKRMMERCVFFLSRYRNGIVLLDATNGNRINLLKRLKRQRTLDMDVLLSATYRLPVRLVACPVPVAVANQRRRKAKMNRDKRFTYGKETLFLMGWNIFITNVSRDVWRCKDFLPAYRLRWRIEIIFKAWKSHLKISELNVASEAMLRLSVMTKLLFCALVHQAYSSIECLSPEHMHVSLLRLARIMSECSSLIAAVVLNVSHADLLAHLILSHAFYEKRTDRLNFAQLVHAVPLG